jgi:hydrogenase small subunit
MAETIHRFVSQARYVVAVGSCAAFGGISAAEPNPGGACGLQYGHHLSGGWLGSDFVSGAGLPVINIAGCPIHPDWVIETLLLLQQDALSKDDLDPLNRPRFYADKLVHHGCSRNEYFEWKIDTEGFGLKEGCLFYEQGCQGPYTRGSCNKILWNDASSKTIVGTPCFGCTEPSFPKTALFSTKTNMGIPATMPLGISRRAYLTLTGVVKSFKIKRFTERLLEYDK